MTQQLGQKIMVGFQGSNPQDPSLQPLFQAIEQGHVGGVILFAYNIVSQGQTQDLIGTLNALKTPHPLLIAVDQEGGRVQRLSSKNGFKDFPSALVVAETMSVEEAYEHYLMQAEIVKAVGFNVVFGPVVDLHSLVSPVIGAYGRAYHADPDKVAAYGKAFVLAHQKHGILTSLKHFPGHGLASKDSHVGLVDITETFQEAELKPFATMIQEGFSPMVMTGHLWHRKWDETHPVTLSSTIIQTKLRKELAYDGVVITDDLAMGAIQRNYGFEDALIKAAQADNDILLYSFNKAAMPEGVVVNKDESSPSHLYHVLKKAVEEGKLSTDQITSSCQRILALKQLLLSTPWQELQPSLSSR